METFLVVSGARRAEDAARVAQSVLQGEFDALYGRTLFDVDDAAFGHARLVTSAPRGRGAELVHAAEDQGRACVVFGTLAEPGDPAARVLRAFASGGVAEAAALDGCYCAVVSEADRRALHVFGDLAGQRTARVAEAGGTVLAAPHDLSLLASGLVKPELDTRAAASLAGFGWPLGDVPLIRGVRAVRPWEAFEATPEGTRVRPLARPPVEPGQDVAELIVRSLAPRIGGGELTVELTAGLDSRAALAAALACKPASGLRAFTDGPADSLDVRVAREVARRAGVRFENPEGQTRDLEGLALETDALAWSCNGVGNASFLTTSPPVDFTSRPARSLSGEGGETFTGLYYPWHPVLMFPDASSFDAFEVAARRHRDVPMAWADEELANAWREQLRAAFRPGTQGYEVLDALYTDERSGVWNQKQRRWPGALGRVSPFDSRAAIAAARAYPSPLARHVTPHADLIRRHLPQAYALPVNAAIRLPLRHGPAPLRLVQRGIEFEDKARRKVMRKLGRGGAVTLEDVRGASFGRAVTDGLLPTRLEAPGSVASQLFGEAEAARAVEGFKAGDGAASVILGELYVADAYLAAARRLSVTAQAAQAARGAATRGGVAVA